MRGTSLPTEPDAQLHSFVSHCDSRYHSWTLRPREQQARRPFSATGPCPFCASGIGDPHMWMRPHARKRSIPVQTNVLTAHARARPSSVGPVKLASPLGVLCFSTSRVPLTPESLPLKPCSGVQSIGALCLSFCLPPRNFWAGLDRVVESLGQSNGVSPSHESTTSQESTEGLSLRPQRGLTEACCSCREAS